MIESRFRKIKLGFYRAFERAMARPKTTLAIFSLVVAICFSMLPRLKMELSTYDIDEPRFPSTERLRSFVTEFQDGNSVLILVRRRAGDRLTVADYCGIESWMKTQRRTNLSLVSAQSASDVVVPVLTDTYLGYRRLLRTDCETVTPTEAGAPVPLEVFKQTPWEGLITDPQAKDLALQFVFKDLAPDSPERRRYGKFNPQVIGDLFADFRKGVLAANPALEAHYAGRASFQWFQKQALGADARLNLLLLVVLVLLFRVFFGTWASGLILVGTLMTSATITYGAMAAVGIPVDTLSNGLFLMLCVSGMEDFVFVSFQHLRGPRSWRSHFKAVLIPGFFTSFTTIVGFLSLGTSDMHLIARFGVCAAFAAFVEWAVTFFALPALLQSFGWSGNWADRKRARFSGLVEHLGRLEFSRGLSRIAVAVAALSVVGFFFLRHEASPRAYFPDGHPQSQTYAYTQRTRGWEAMVLVLFSDSSERERNQRILEQIKKLPNVARVDDPYLVIDFMSKGLPDSVAQLVRREISVSKPYAHLFSKRDRAKATVYLKDFDLRPLNGALAGMREICSPANACEVVGEGVVYSEFSEKVVNSLFGSFFSCLLVTGLLLGGLVAATQGSLKALGPILLSSFWAPVVSIGALALFRIPIDYFNSMFATVLVGLTGDNAVQYLFAASKTSNLRSGVQKRAGASAVVTLFNMAGSLCFLGMTPQPLKRLGALLCFGFFASLCGDLWLLKGLLREPSEKL